MHPITQYYFTKQANMEERIKSEDLQQVFKDAVRSVGHPIDIETKNTLSDFEDSDQIFGLLNKRRDQMVNNQSLGNLNALEGKLNEGMKELKDKDYGILGMFDKLQDRFNYAVDGKSIVGKARRDVGDQETLSHMHGLEADLGEKELKDQLTGVAAGAGPLLILNQLRRMRKGRM